MYCLLTAYMYIEYISFQLFYELIQLMLAGCQHLVAFNCKYVIPCLYELFK